MCSNISPLKRGARGNFYAPQVFKARSQLSRFRSIYEGIDPPQAMVIRKGIALIVLFATSGLRLLSSLARFYRWMHRNKRFPF
jgi:hypothetical protein